MTAGKTSHFSSSKKNTNLPSQNSVKFHFRAAQKIQGNQAKIANLILKKYEEIGKILAGMIFKGLHN